MTSTNAAPSEVTHYWFGWLSVPGHGRAWAHGEVTVPLSAPHEQTYRLIAAWLHEHGCLVPADISQVITLLPGRISPDPLANDSSPRSS
ncbi:hypothetical protein [Streptomyces sp. Ru72]|uniref:hypothetical protein n=1 Tax=Streptomyces sp. Ru72 TaxID=2080747 RepID=UPI000CDD3F02|nr:hypothetical protein [Streptomyces sp. Ru72]POX44967.1 hypothetical protein C3488_31045 [Streptomyces sp. Ru72]